MNKKKRDFALIALAVFLFTSLLVAYLSYSIRQVRQDYDLKITGLNDQMQSNLQDLKENLGSQIDALGNNLSSQVGSVESELKDFKNQNQKEISTLSNLVDQIEQQSDIKLNELKQELKDIQIRSADFSAIVDDVLNSVVSIKTNLGQGSGVVIDRKGYIVTNVHVIKGASSIKAATYSGKIYNVDVVAGYDEAADIAVLKVSADLDALEFGDSDEVKVGEKVIAAGNPAGLSFTVTEGIVSAFRTFDGIKYIQTDVPLNPGNSGGPLINAKAEIIGINNFKVGDSESLGFAISSNIVRSIAEGIIGKYEAGLNQ